MLFLEPQFPLLLELDSNIESFDIVLLPRLLHEVCAGIYPAVEG